MKSFKDKQELQNLVNKCYSYADVCRTLELVPRGSNYTTVKNILQKNQIDVSHFNQGT